MKVLTGLVLIIVAALNFFAFLGYLDLVSDRKIFLSLYDGIYIVLNIILLFISIILLSAAAVSTFTGKKSQLIILGGVSAVIAEFINIWSINFGFTNLVCIVGAVLAINYFNSIYYNIDE
jgi:hypothetical protein